jgi:hypothetical protein
VEEKELLSEIRMRRQQAIKEHRQGKRGNHSFDALETKACAVETELEL